MERECCDKQNYRTIVLSRYLTTHSTSCRTRALLISKNTYIHNDAIISSGGELAL